MGMFSPLVIAIVKKVLLSSGRLGSPKETLETPSAVFTPSVRTMERARTVSETSACSADAVKTRVSIITLRRGIPYSSARLTMRCAIAKRSWAVRGTPRPSIVSPRTTAPYFFAIGKTRAITSSSPLTLLIRGTPL